MCIRPVRGLVALNGRSSRPVKSDNLLLLSDGFYRLVDVFKAMTPADLMERTIAKGLPELYSQLRALEVADAACADHPRVKAYDDASAILVALSQKPKIAAVYLPNIFNILG